MTDKTPYANTIFEQPWWLEAVSPSAWHESIVTENDEVIGRLPFVLQKKRFGVKAIHMPRYTQTIGPWIKHREFEVGNSHLSKQKAIIKMLLNNLPKVKYLNINTSLENTYVLPYSWNGYHITPLFTYRIPDLTDLEDLASKFHKTVHKNIRSASKKVEIKDDVDLDIIFTINEKLFKNQGRNDPTDKQVIERIVAASLAHNAGKMLYAVDSQGNIHGYLFLVYDENVCYYLLAGSNPEFRSSGAQSLLLWEAIKFSATVSKAFDFEGSNVEGIENFVRQFGSPQFVYYNISKQPFLYDFLEILKPRVKKVLRSVLPSFFSNK